MMQTVKIPVSHIWYDHLWVVDMLQSWMQVVQFDLLKSCKIQPKKLNLRNFILQLIPQILSQFQSDSFWYNLYAVWTFMNFCRKIY